MQIKLILVMIVTVVAKQQYAYTIRYSRSYNPTKVPMNVGCAQKNVVYGNFIYPQGPTDVMYFILNPHTYNVYLQCQNEKLFAKAFGTGQDYELLLKADPTTVANGLRGSINTQYIIIDWKYPPSKNYTISQQWLVSFVTALNNFNKTVYVKARASSFCYRPAGQKQGYLLTEKLKAKMIVEMYGQQQGQYTTYEKIFGDQSDVNENTYCSGYPTYAFFAKRFPDKDFYIEKTLQKQQAGYIGPKLQKFLAKAQSVYDKIVFLDSYSRELIDL